MTAQKASLFFLSVMVMGGVAHAEPERGRPASFGRLVDCRSIADDRERLACYDKAVGELDAAERKKDVVIVDRKEMQATRRSLFGFTLPKIGIFTGDKDDDKEDVDEVVSTIESARGFGYGFWVLRLANDAGTWETTSRVSNDPRTGDKIRIKKASMGSYLAQVGENRGVRLRRVK